MKTAVIATGGKQYLVHEGDVIQVEKLPAAVGDTVTFKEVLLAANDHTVKVGQPQVTGATVKAKIVRQFKTKKIMGAKMKAKKRYLRIFGHRQPQTAISITTITAASR